MSKFMSPMKLPKVKKSTPAAKTVPIGPKKHNARTHSAKKMKG